MVKPHAPLLDDDAVVVEWLVDRGFTVDAAGLREFRRCTGRGMTRDVLKRIATRHRFAPSAADYVDLTMNLSAQGARERAAVKATGRLARTVSLAATPDVLNGLWPKVSAALDADPGALGRLAGPWREATQRLEAQGVSALEFAGDAHAATRSLTHMTLARVLRTRDMSLVARWGAEAVEAARFSRAELGLALGLDDLVEDLLVGAGHGLHV